MEFDFSDFFHFSVFLHHDIDIDSNDGKNADGGNEDGDEGIWSEHHEDKTNISKNVVK